MSRDTVELIALWMIVVGGIPFTLGNFLMIWLRFRQ